MEKYSKPQIYVVLFNEQDVIVVSQPGDYFEDDDFSPNPNA